MSNATEQTERQQPEQFDFFVASLVPDLPLKDQREAMERPFFSLSKRKRLKPIEYTSATDVYVNVSANPKHGMATIWDADVLIWAASQIQHLKRQGVNDLPRTLKFQAYDLLKAIGRQTGGDQYHRLREAMARLQATTIATNIRSGRRNRHRQFSWIDSWDDFVDPRTRKSKGMSLTLSDWFYEGVVMKGGLLSIDPAYFRITGGRERWLYRVARKHAGGAGEDGFSISFPVLYEKSGSEGSYRRFKYEMLVLVQRDALPGYELALEIAAGEPSLLMTRRDGAAPRENQAPSARGRTKAAAGELPLFPASHLDGDAIDRFRSLYPAWNVSGIQAEFDAWIAKAPAKRQPQDYQKAFLGFAKTFVERRSR